MLASITSGVFVLALNEPIVGFILSALGYILMRGLPGVIKDLYRATKWTTLLPFRGIHATYKKFKKAPLQVTIRELEKDPKAPFSAEYIRYVATVSDPNTGDIRIFCRGSHNSNPWVSRNTGEEVKYAQDRKLCNALSVALRDFQQAENDACIRKNNLELIAQADIPFPNSVDLSQFDVDGVKPDGTPHVREDLLDIITNPSSDADESIKNLTHRLNALENLTGGEHTRLETKIEKEHTRVGKIHERVCDLESLSWDPKILETKIDDLFDRLAKLSKRTDAVEDAHSANLEFARSKRQEICRTVAAIKKDLKEHQSLSSDKRADLRIALDRMNDRLLRLEMPKPTTTDNQLSINQNHLSISQNQDGNSFQI